ncbi:MAG TPA: MFS transporter [Chloroflexia bacterium]|nr:MFS transporter [Chloroflexia bacterium]
MSSSPNFNPEENQPDFFAERKRDKTRRTSLTYGAADSSAPGVENSLKTENPAIKPAFGNNSNNNGRDGNDGDGWHEGGGTPEGEKGHTSIFHNRNFMLLWIAQALSQTAQNTLNLALVNYVNTLSGGSPTQTAIATVAFVLPGVFFSALAGAFVDRVNKRTILIVTNVLRAAVIPWLVFMAGMPIALALPLIFLITCLFSTFSQFFAPAEGAMIPFLVKEEHLTRANSLFQITLFGAQFVGFSILAPLLPRWIGSQNLFWALAAIYGVCILLTWWLPNNLEKDRKLLDKEATSVVRSMWSEIKDGWHYIRTHKDIWRAIVYLSTVQSVLFTLTAIGIPYVSQKGNGLGQSESDIIYILAPLSIGLGIGVWLVNKLVTPRNRERIMVWATVAMGATLVGVGLIKPLADLWVHIFSPGVPIGGPLLFVGLILLSICFGFQIAMLNIPALTLLQEKSPKDIVGRVFAAYFTFANLVSIFPILFGGAMGDLIGLVPTFFIIGLGVASIGYYGYRQTSKHTLISNKIES